MTTNGNERPRRKSFQSELLISALCSETYQPAEKSTYSENINSFWVKRFPWMPQPFFSFSKIFRAPKTAIFAKQIIYVIFRGKVITAGAGKLVANEI
jgi:hypothetical protein